MKSPSIRRALLIRCGIGVGTLLCFLSTAIYLLVRHSLYLEMDKSITQTAALLGNQVELEDEKVSFEWQEGLGSNETLILEGLFQFWDDHTGETTRSPALQSEDLPKFHGTSGSPLVKNITLPNGDHGRAIGLQIHPFVLPDEMARMRQRGKVIDPKSLTYTLVVAADIERVHHTLDDLRYVLASGTLLTLALGFTLIDHVIRISLRPINELTRQMDERAEHQLDSALTVPGELPAELTGLAKNFDSLLARVAATRQRERDFIRHAAHELRTPIAGLRATTDLALSQPRDAAAYAAHLETCRETAIDLGELVKRLSALARIGQPSRHSTTEPIDFESLLGERLRSFIPAFEKRGLKITRTRSQSPQLALGDITLARIVLNNLLDNAASHAPAGSEIVIRTGRANGRVQVSVSNPAEDLPDDPERLFEPLFRRESSRHDAESHLGIGLTLSLDAANAMGGTLQAHKTADGRIEFIFGLPSAE